MPRLRPKPKFADGDIVRCWHPFATAAGAVYNRASKRRGDHPDVRAHPDHFVLETTEPKDEPNFLEGMKYSRDPAGIKILDTIPPHELAVSTENFYADNRFINKGQRLRRTDPLVAKHPEFFTTAPQPLKEPA